MNRRCFGGALKATEGLCGEAARKWSLWQYRHADHCYMADLRMQRKALNKTGEKGSPGYVNDVTILQMSKEHGETTQYIQIFTGTHKLWRSAGKLSHVCWTTWKHGLDWKEGDVKARFQIFIQLFWMRITCRIYCENRYALTECHEGYREGK